MERDSWERAAAGGSDQYYGVGGNITEPVRGPQVTVLTMHRSNQWRKTLAFGPVEEFGGLGLEH